MARTLILMLCALSFTACTCQDKKMSEQARYDAIREAKTLAVKRRNEEMAARREEMKALKVERATVGIYFIDAKKVESGDPNPYTRVEREVGANQVAKNAVWQMFQGPTLAEKAVGLSLQKSGAEGFQRLKRDGALVELHLRGGCSNEGGTYTVFDHLTRTLKDLEGVEHVRLFDPDGKTGQPAGKVDSRPACLEP